MGRLLSPDEKASSIFEIDYDALYAAGKRVLLFDLDNTLGEGRPDRLAPAARELLLRLRKDGFRIGVITNRRRPAELPVFRDLSEHALLYHRACKPLKRGFLSLLEKLDASVDQAVMIGDRRLTDVFGANRVGIYTILLREGA
ncbi:MAG TPA: YqeG family HAD IIIA-type phosphatase [Candidatus Acetothermia bacterium]|nr:YqeG family HAD IIIA-type phosphatase [Candidatus Acetothermia bacterium]